MNDDIANMDLKINTELNSAAKEFQNDMPASAKRDENSFAWWQKMQLYQVYLRSFCDGNADGVGDIPGLINKLDYLKKLGANVLWLSPINVSPNIDFGYDIADYKAIDPSLGTMADFDRLISQARTRGIKIILDGVFNHCSDQHPWFVQARENKNSPYRDYFHWQQQKTPNNWASVIGKTAWQWCEKAGASYLHTFLPQQPDLNWHNPKLQKEILDIMRFWLDRGVSGFRLDLFNCYAKDKLYRSNPYRSGLRGLLRRLTWPYGGQHHVYDRDLPQLENILGNMRALVKEYDGVLLGETMDDHHDYIEASRWVNSKHLDLAFNFKLLNCSWCAVKMREAIASWVGNLAADAWPTWAVSNHDYKRHATRWGRRHAKPRMRLVAMMLLTLRGSPCIYQGEEIGMRQGKVNKKSLQDTLGKLLWPFYKGRDGCRTPMQWDDAIGAGFSTETPWLPVNQDYLQRNVAKQQQDKDSLLCFYQSLNQLRQNTPALLIGDMHLLPQNNKKIISWTRSYGEDTFLIVLNMSGKKTKFYSLPEYCKNYQLVMSTGISEEQKSALLSAKEPLLLACYEGCVLRLGSG